MLIAVLGMAESMSRYLRMAYDRSPQGVREWRKQQRRDRRWLEAQRLASRCVCGHDVEKHEVAHRGMGGCVDLFGACTACGCQSYRRGGRVR